MSAREDLKRLGDLLRPPRLGALFEEVEGEGYREGEPGSSLRSVTFEGEPEPPPWFVRVVLGVGAWVAAGLLILALGLADMIDDEVGALVVGLLLLAGGGGLRYAVRRASFGQDFFRQLALALGLAGLGLSVFGASQVLDDDTAAQLFALALGLLTLLLFPDALLRFAGAAASAIALLLLCIETELPGALDAGLVLLMAAASLLWLAPPRLDLGLFGPRRAPAAYAFLLSALVALVASVSWGRHEELLLWPTTAALALGLLGVAAYALRRGGRSPLSVPGIALAVATVGIGLLTRQAPGILAALLVFVLAVQRRSALLMGLACCFLGGFLSHFYYSLELSLFAKSGALVGGGLLLLLLGAYLHRRARLALGPAPAPVSGEEASS